MFISDLQQPTSTTYHMQQSPPRVSPAASTEAEQPAAHEENPSAMEDTPGTAAARRPSAAEPAPSATSDAVTAPERMRFGRGVFVTNGATQQIGIVVRDCVRHVVGSQKMLFVGVLNAAATDCEVQMWRHTERVATVVVGNPRHRDCMQDWLDDFNEHTYDIVVLEEDDAGVQRMPRKRKRFDAAQEELLAKRAERDAFLD